VGRTRRIPQTRAAQLPRRLPLWLQALLGVRQRGSSVLSGRPGLLLFHEEDGTGRRVIRRSSGGN